MVVPSFLINQAEIAKGVKKVEKKFRPDVVRISYEIRENWMGDPAIYFRVLLSDEAADRFTTAVVSKTSTGHELPRHVRDAIDALIDPLGKWGLFPHVSFRSVSEQAYLKDKDWE
jgi:hypothetical protein